MKANITVWSKTWLIGFGINNMWVWKVRYTSNELPATPTLWVAFLCFEFIFNRFPQETL